MNPVPDETVARPVDDYVAQIAAIVGPHLSRSEGDAVDALTLAKQIAALRATEDVDALHEAQMEAEHHKEQERYWKARAVKLADAEEVIFDLRELIRKAAEASDPGEAVRQLAALSHPCDHDFQMHPLSDDFGVCSLCGAELAPGTEGSQ